MIYLHLIWPFCELPLRRWRATGDIFITSLSFLMQICTRIEVTATWHDWRWNCGELHDSHQDGLKAETGDCDMFHFLYVYVCLKKHNSNEEKVYFSQCNLMLWRCAYKLEKSCQEEGCGLDVGITLWLMMRPSSATNARWVNEWMKEEAMTAYEQKQI